MTNHDERRNRLRRRGRPARTPAGVPIQPRPTADLADGALLAGLNVQRPRIGVGARRAGAPHGQVCGDRALPPDLRRDAR